MSELNRTLPPPAHPIETIEIIDPLKYSLPNQLPVFEISAGSQETIKIELIFNAGNAHHANPLVPAFTIAMLQEGTKNKTSKEIAAAIDDYGAFLETDQDKDYTSIMLFTLNRHLEKTLPVIKEIITDSIFPEKELEIMRSNRLEKYRINKEKVSYLASKYFQELIFKGSPYGGGFEEESFAELNKEKIVDFWKSHYDLSNTMMFVSGRTSDAERKIIGDIFGQTASFTPNFNLPLETEKSSGKIPSENFIHKENAIQSAIRIGRKLFKKGHPDYYPMKVLTTVLGGYFGSRLMSNIREDKGYTYGIGAGLASNREAGYFYISTEVGSDVCKNAMEEIYKEIQLLREELISEEELELVKNYMLGNILKSFDGPFERMERFKSTLLYGLEYNTYLEMAKVIREIRAENLRDLANKWLQKEDLIELVVGKK